MGTIEYDTAPPERAEYLELFETTGWNDAYRASAAELADALARSWYSVAAYDAGRLVGFGRVVSDGVLYAMIYDMVVRPSHKGRGIGTEILRRLVARCNEAGIREVQLFCAKGKLDFYRRRGFKERPKDAPGMRLANG